MTTLQTAAQQALEALDGARRYGFALKHKEVDALLDALRAALAEPVRKPLTEEEIEHLLSTHERNYDMVNFARAIERAHGIT